MKRKGKIWFFLAAFVILFLAVSTITGITKQYGDVKTPIVKGVKDIRFGIDIRGGVDVTFVPADGTDATESQMNAAQAVIEQRLIGLGITDYELYKDVDDSRIILRFPWQVGETEFNPEAAIQELSTAAILTFREGMEVDEQTGEPTGVTAENIILEGNDVVSAEAKYVPATQSKAAEYMVELNLTAEAGKKFEEATTKLAAEDGVISIWMDNEMISYPSVNEPIAGTTAVITSPNFDAEAAEALANKINAGALPFALEADSFSTISPTLGSNSLQAMILAGIIALILICAFMIYIYRLTGVVASLALIGQVAGMLALVSGYFAVFNSFTLTLPGIAGIILAIGMGVDANVIQGERIKEEFRSGKRVDAALKSGFQRGLTPVIDGNVTVIIVAVILMGAFGPPDSFFAKMLYPLFFAFGISTAGTIYSFGFTLLTGVLLNFVFSVLGTRIMLTSLSKWNTFRKPNLYGVPKNAVDMPPDVPNYNVVGRTKVWFGLSGAIIAVILVVTLVFGVQMDVQFKGGAIIAYSYKGVDLDTAEAEAVVDEIVGGEAGVQVGDGTGGGKTFTITMPGSQTVDAAELEALTTALQEKYPDAGFEQLSVSNVDATIGNTFLWKCVVALLAASVLILAYIAFRFRKIGGWVGGMTAVVALVHDLIVIYGVFVIMRIPLNGNFIAALLTILGYSINDTVVIYDRVRENRALYGKKMSFANLMNLSINQSLKRSVYTTLTTLIALGCVCIFAVVYKLDSIFTFAFPMMIGMVSGVYSTVCIAGPLWVLIEGHREKKEKNKKGASSAKGDSKAVKAKSETSAEAQSAKA